MVERFNAYGTRLDDHEPVGSAYYVRSSDYDALAARLAEAERERDNALELLREALPILETMQGEDEDLGPAYNELMYGIDAALGLTPEDDDSAMPPGHP